MAEEKTFLVPQEVYLKSGIHIGTKFKTKYMEKFIYKTRPDGLSVLNLQRIDERIKLGAKFLSNYNPKDILIVSRRENGWNPVKMFGEMTGANVIPGRYPPGMMTNPQLATYKDIRIVLVTDAWPDRNAIRDAMNVGIPVIALCDTNNQANNIDFVMPCNNKGRKSIGLLFYILAKEYMKNRGMIKNESEMKYSMEDFIEER